MIKRTSKQNKSRSAYESGMDARSSNMDNDLHKLFLEELADI